MNRSDAAAAHFEQLLDFAGSNSEVLGFAVTGSRAVGFERPESDYDCALFQRDGSELDVEGRLGPSVEGVGLRVFTPTSFAGHARWGSETAWDRYAWFIADFRVDRTHGDLVAAAREKGRVPSEEVAAHVDASLDWYLNQVARSIRCWARGDELGGRLEGAEAVRPFLQASFAIHDRRLVPYYKYLTWEVEQRPLYGFDLEPHEFVSAVSAVVTDGSLAAHQRLLDLGEALFRREGYARRFDEWDTAGWKARYFGGS